MLIVTEYMCVELQSMAIIMNILVIKVNFYSFLFKYICQCKISLKVYKHFAHRPISTQFSKEIEYGEHICVFVIECINSRITDPLK